MSNQPKKLIKTKTNYRNKKENRIIHRNSSKIT